MEKYYNILKTTNDEKLIIRAKNILHYLKDSIELTKHDYKFMNELNAEFARDNWNIVVKDGTTLGTVKIPGTGACTIMVTEVLDVDIFRFLAILTEPSLVYKWLPNCSRSGLLK